jgi:hypothetical protein
VEETGVVRKWQLKLLSFRETTADDLIEGGGGIRKLRQVLPGRGIICGARVIYPIAFPKEVEQVLAQVGD